MPKKLAVAKRSLRDNKIFFQRLTKMFNSYSKLLIINIDNVSSKQVQDIRAALRGKAELLFGKNTLIRGNIGFVFTNAKLKEIKDVIESIKIGAPARVGSVAPIEVIIQAGNTGLPPEQTGFFQALQIPTKIVRGTIEIMTQVTLVKAGSKVGTSEAALASLLKMTPFSYSASVTHVYDNGVIYKPEVLETPEETLVEIAQTAIANMTALSLATGVPSPASISYLLSSAVRNVAALGIATTVTLPQMKDLKDRVAHPERYHVATATVASGTASGTASGSGVLSGTASGVSALSSSSSSSSDDKKKGGDKKDDKKKDEKKDEKKKDDDEDSGIGGVGDIFS